jgi:UPF0489 domain
MNFLIPLLKRGYSASHDDNVLWQKENVFVMDNHRLALWCWFQKIEKKKRYNLLHIDAHPDMSESALKHFNHDLWTISLSDYRTSLQADINTPLFRWDNYIEIFLKNYPEVLGSTYSATHQMGSEKTLGEEVKPVNLAKFCHSVFSGERFINDLPWIVNLDLDYFFSAAPQKFELFSGEFVKSIADSIQKGLESKMIDVLTISLSPECCGSWEKAEKMLERFSKEASEALK